MNTTTLAIHLLRRLAIVVAAAIAIGSPAIAQVTGQVSGTVVDDSGAAIAGAAVIVLDAGGAELRRTVTDAGGGFAVDGLRSARYVVQVEQPLFNVSRQTVVLGADRPHPPLRFVLSVASVRENVTVAGAPPAERLSLDAPDATGSRLGLTPRETPASVTIVERATIDQRGATDTQEILNSVPGLTAAAPPGSAGSVSYRGFGTSQITQLFNGITVQYDAIAARPVDSWIYDRVEVIGGPSTFLFGAGAVGGSINYVTRLAERDRNDLQARVSAGSYGTGEVDLGVNRRLGGSRVHNAIRFDLSRSGSNGYVDRAGRAALTTAASLLTDVGQRFSHTLAVEYQNEQADSPYWGTPLLNPTTGAGRINPATRFKNYNSVDGIYEQTVLWARSIAEYRPSPRLSLRNTFYYYDALRDYRNVEVYRYDAANAAVARSSPLLQRHDQRLAGNRLEVRYGGRLGGLVSDWAGGLDVSDNRQTRFPLSLTSTVSVVDPVSFTTEQFFDVPGMVPGFTPDRRNEVATIALFVENRTKLHDAVALVTALRRDRIDLDGTNLRPGTISPTNPASFENIYTPVTGRIGLVYDVAPAANVYAQFSTAADPPSGILTTASFAQVRDFDLTTGRQFEVGSKFDLPARRGVATAAYFQITRENLAIADPLNPGTTIPVGQQSSRGIELAASYRPNRIWLVQGNYGYVDAAFDDFVENVGGIAVSRNGNTPMNTPAHVTNLWITATVTAALEAGIEGRWVSSRFGNTANTLWDDGYGLYGLFGTYRVRPRVAVTARVRNLGDEVYARSITGTPMFFLGAPRSFEVALKVGFQ
jgi:iron complex outermembrane receptor protein